MSKNGNKTPILLYDIKYVPSLHCNLLSLSKAMKVFELIGKDDQLKLKLKNLEYSFDHKIKSGTGFLFGLKVVTGKGNTMVPYRKGHMFLMHANEVTTKATMKKLKFVLGLVPDKRANIVLSQNRSRKTCARPSHNLISRKEKDGSLTSATSDGLRWDAKSSGLCLSTISRIIVCQNSSIRKTN